MENKINKLKNLDAEKSIIAELLNNAEAIANIQNLKPGHFYSNKYRKLYKKILKLSQENKPVDIIILSNQLNIKVSELSYLIGESISAIKVKEYENIIINNWIKRKLIESGYRFVNNISRPENNPADIISDLSNQFDKILQVNNNSEKLGNIEPALNELISKRVDDIDNTPGIKTGYPGIDKKTAGLQKGDFVIIGADTSVGKTALALNITENILFRDKPYPIGYISLELTKAGILDRLICTRANININDFYNKEITFEGKQRYQNIASQLNQKPLYIIDNSTNLNDITTKINLLYKNYKTRIIFIDNLQNILGHSGQDFRKLITESTKKLKAIAKRLNISIIALSHLSRGDNSKTPRLSDLKESSSIEQDADKVILIHRPYKGAGLRDFKEDCTLKLAKNRQGHTGKIDLIFNRKIARFENKPKAGF
ncbi:MAG: AAA family ATPase [Candidatus Marinimicrobia bacterium]|nr:AAA family ATPase [Candidatus Neomarinimicrobiota bacterium]